MAMAGLVGVVGCSSDSSSSPTTPVAAATTLAEPEPTEPDAPAGPDAPTTDAPATEAPATDVSDTAADTVPPATTASATGGTRAGAASRSILPTVDGARDYLEEVPGWDDVDPDDPGVFVPEWDQGRVDVGNGNEDGSWVHDDLRTTAVAIEQGGHLVVFAMADVYMIFAADAAEITSRARALLPADVRDTVDIVISATHNHEGPDTAFSVNDDWYEVLADQMAAAIAESVERMEPADIRVASGTHGFGVADARDPMILDLRLNVMRISAAGDPHLTIATIAQWASHPETTLGWAPPIDLAEACATKGWEGDDCTAEGRYFTADYPGILRERLIATYGGEAMYFNGAIGSQIGPGHADVWRVDDAHPVDDSGVAPAGAAPVAGAADLRDQNFARTEAIGGQLADHVSLLSDEAAAADAIDVQVNVREEPFYTRLSNIGFRVLLADGDLGWQTPAAYTCDRVPFTDETCASDDGTVVDDPLLTPLVDSQIRRGDVLKTQLIHVDLGDVGFLFMPGELPPELVIGLPDDFATDTATYFEHPDLHATGDAYTLPGALLDLVDDDVEFTVGLGGDELGYFVPVDDIRLKCLDLALPVDGGYTCQRMFDEGLLVTPDAVAGTVCVELADNPDLLTQEDVGQPARLAVNAVCRYGQALGRELGEPDDHYEETNSAGWDLVGDVWTAALQLFAGT